MRLYWISAGPKSHEWYPYKGKEREVWPLSLWHFVTAAPGT